MPRYLDIENLIFGVEYEKNTVLHLDKYCTSVSYLYTCKNENRIANLPGGPFKFMYNDEVYSFDTESFTVDSLINSIIKVVHTYLIHFQAARLNGVILLQKGLTMAYNGVVLKDPKTIKSVLSTSNSVVSVFFDSKYATITPSDTCIHVEESSLQQLLDDGSLLKYKSICIHRKSLYMILHIVDDKRVHEVINELIGHYNCFPHLSTLIIVGDDHYLPDPSSFSALFKYNCFPSLNRISILVSIDYPLKEESYHMIKEEKLIQMEDSYIDQPRNIQIGKLQFGIDYVNNTAHYLDNYYSSTSYVYTCKSGNRLANLPGGSMRFEYNNHHYSFSIKQRACRIKDCIVEVSFISRIHLQAARLNGVFLRVDDLEITVNGIAISGNESIKKMATVNVKFNSEYSTITPSDNCVDIDACNLSQSLAKYTLLKYKSLCIHRKKFLGMISYS